MRKLKPLSSLLMLILTLHGPNNEIEGILMITRVPVPIDSLMLSNTRLRVTLSDLVVLLKMMEEFVPVLVVLSLAILFQEVANIRLDSTSRKLG